MTLSNEVITALIGVFSALIIVVLKDILLSTIRERHTSKRSLLQARIEHAYTPLGHLAFMLLQTDAVEEKAQINQEIGTILRNYAHLLSDQASAALYTLLEDENAGAYLLQQHFYAELDQIKEEYYHYWHSPTPSNTIAGRILGNHGADIYMREEVVATDRREYTKGGRHDADSGVYRRSFAYSNSG